MLKKNLNKGNCSKCNSEVSHNELKNNYFLRLGGKYIKKPIGECVCCNKPRKRFSKNENGKIRIKK